MLQVFQKLNADRISLVFCDWDDFENNGNIIRRAITHFAKYNIEVAVWLNSLLHLDYSKKGNFSLRKYGDGHENYCCPLDENFVRFFSEYVAKYAKTGTKLIYLDDDFRFGVSGGPNCFCDLHMQEYKKLLGDDVTADKIVERIESRKPNKYRDAWISVNGAALKKLAKAVRDAVDNIDTSVRVGICASPTTMFGIDGASAFELSEILAGKNEPFIRLIGAPYWAYHAERMLNARLGDVIGLERLELSYVETLQYKGEVLSEGDTYPRTRFDCPASYLELFHSALSTENRLDGILKYPGEYTSYKDEYESGFSRLASYNREKRETVEEAFLNTDKVGFKILEIRDKMKTEEFLPEDVPPMEFERIVMPASIRAFTDLSLPYTFTGNGPTVAFGDNARYLSLEELRRGVITDIVGARILKEKGIDVGIKDFGEEVVVGSCYEYYNDFDDEIFVHFYRAANLFNLQLEQKAEVLTSTIFENRKYSLTYRYEGTNGKIAVCCVDTTQTRGSFGYFKSYYKQRVFADLYKWFAGEELAAVSFDCPFLMQIVGKKEGKCIVGFWNIYQDGVANQPIYLQKKYHKAEFIGCDGRLEGEQLILNYLPGYDFCAIVYCFKMNSKFFLVFFSVGGTSRITI